MHGSVYATLSIHPTLSFSSCVHSPFSTSVSLFLPCKYIFQFNFSRFHIYALIYYICFSFSDWLHSIWQTLDIVHIPFNAPFCSVQFGVFFLCQYHYLTPEYFHHPREKIHTHYHSLYSLQPLKTTHLLYVFIDLPNLSILSKWNHAVCGLWCLASFTAHHVFRLHPCCPVCQYCIPLYCSIIF